MRRIFDPDLRVQNWMPADLTFPLWAKVDLTQVDESALICLPKPHVGQLTVLVLLVRPHPTIPGLVWVWHEQREHQFCIPWQACSPEITLLPN